MSRLRYKIGDRVILEGEDQTLDASLTITRVEPALEEPYFLSNNQWHAEDTLTTYVEPVPTWEQVEVHVKHIVQELREKFQANNENSLLFEIVASGRPDGEIKITYKLADSEYGSNKVKAFSLRPCLDEFFRRKTWTSRNEPLALAYDGGDND